VEDYHEMYGLSLCSILDVFACNICNLLKDAFDRTWIEDVEKNYKVN
jgi:hypothetical protein